jgi:hypothetical protein
MTFNLDGDEALSAAIAGLPKIAELIAAVPAEDRARALEAAEKSYVQTALTLGYEDANARQWVSIGVRSGPQIGIQEGPPRFAFRTISVRPVGAGRGCGDGASAG